VHDASDALLSTSRESGGHRCRRAARAGGQSQSALPRLRPRVGDRLSNRLPAWRRGPADAASRLPQLLPQNFGRRV